MNTAADNSGQDVIIVSGRSGGGKSTALNALEDLGYQVNYGAAETYQGKSGLDYLAFLGGGVQSDMDTITVTVGSGVDSTDNDFLDASLVGVSGQVRDDLDRRRYDRPEAQPRKANRAPRRRRRSHRRSGGSVS